MATPVNILLVDDQPANLDALEAVLTAPDYNLIRAQTANDALMAVLNHEFAALVLDILMPDVSGIELATMIKQRKRTQHIPILFLTAHTPTDRDVLQGYGVGAVDYISKPFNAEILRSKIGVFVDLFRKNIALAAANTELEVHIAERERAQDALRRANEELESRVRQRTADLERAKAEAESANHSKDQFLAVLSHELRTPLTPALMTVQLLEREPALDPQMREAMSTIRRNIEMEARLIDDLLDLTRVAQGKLTLAMQSVDLKLVLRQAIQTCAFDAAERRVHLSSTMCEDEVFVWADPARMQQVFWNLIKNSIKFGPGSHVDIRCNLEQLGADEFVKVDVIDSGIGIDPVRLPRLFDAFEQGGREVTRQFGGLGLGLAISKSLVEMCGGHIEANSGGVGLGATFTVRLRRIRRAMPLTTTLPTPAASTSQANVGVPSLQILLVEDHDDSAELLKIFLSAGGHRVTRASNVASAIAAASSAEFELIISDLGLPDGTGHEVMRTVRQRRAIPGIALSGYGMDSDLQQSHEAGFVEHLVKPVTFEQLVAAIERAYALEVFSSSLK